MSFDNLPRAISRRESVPEVGSEVEGGILTNGQPRNAWLNSVRKSCSYNGCKKPFFTNEIGEY